MKTDRNRNGTVKFRWAVVAHFSERKDMKYYIYKVCEYCQSSTASICVNVARTAAGSGESNGQATSLTTSIHPSAHQLSERSNGSPSEEISSKTSAFLTHIPYEASLL